MFRIQRRHKFAFIAVSGVLACLTLADPRFRGGNPEQFLFDGEKFEYSFDALPLDGDLSKSGGIVPWSDTFWPAYRGGITDAFLESRVEREKHRFHPRMPSPAELATMSAAEIKSLAPSVKFDLASDDYDYTLTNRVLRQYAGLAAKWDDQRGQILSLLESNPNAQFGEPNAGQTWWGICHGWTPAAINFAEPLPSTYTNAANLAIPFASSDVKALLSYLYAWDYAQFNDAGIDQAARPEARPAGIAPFDYRQIGMRCGARDEFESGGNFRHQRRANCRDNVRKIEDIDAGAFHVVIANQIGILKKGIIADVTADRGDLAQVWNQPVVGYHARVAGEKKRPWIAVGWPKGVERKVDVRAQVTYVYEVGSTWGAHGLGFDSNASDGLQGQYVRTYDMNYTLYLDGDRKIIGGKFLSGVVPDFLWKVTPVQFQGPYEILKKIYKPSQPMPGLDLAAAPVAPARAVAAEAAAGERDGLTWPEGAVVQ